MAIITPTPIGSADNAGGFSLYSRLIVRGAFELVGALAIAVWLPLIVRLVVSDLEWTNRWFLQSALFCSSAIVVGYVVYRGAVNISQAQAIRNILVGLTAAFVLMPLLFSLLQVEYSRYQGVLSYLLSIVWLFGIFSVSRRIWPLRILIVPGGASRSLLTIPGLNWEVLESPDLNNLSGAGVVTDHGIRHSTQWDQFIVQMKYVGIPVYDYMSLLESLTGRVDIQHISKNSLDTLIPNPFYIEVKLAADWIVAVIALVLLSPVLLATALVIRLESPGPVVCLQRRVGYGGKVFTLFKFRTLTNETNWGESQQDSENDDRRTTKVGKFLRQYWIDTLPQIANILLGEMSWIGPRPEPETVLRMYQNKPPIYRYRFVVRPGIIGWASVNQEYAADEAGLQCELFYIKNCSPWLDALIALRAVGRMFDNICAR